MKIQVQDKSHNGIVFVKRLSWKERCEEQLSMINKAIQKINEELRSMR